MEKAYRQLNATQFLGDQASANDVLAMCRTITQYTGNVWTIDSWSAEVLELRETGQDGAVALWPVKAGQWCVVAPDFGIINRMSDPAYKARYMPLAAIIAGAVADPVTLNAIASSAAVQDKITAEVNARAMYGGFGKAPAPAISVGVSQPIPVTIAPAQPAATGSDPLAGWVARAFVTSGGTVLSTLTVDSVTKVNGSRVDVVLRNTGLLSVGGVIDVHVTAAVGGASAPSKT